MKILSRISLMVLIVMLIASCSDGEKRKVREKKENPKREKKTSKKKERIPIELRWAISTAAKTPEENLIKHQRRKEKAPELKLSALFDKANGFRELIKPISDSDSVVKFIGFDFMFFVPSMEPFDEPQRFVLYRRGSEEEPGAIKLIDSLGPNNAEVFPFYWNNTAIFFIHYFGSDPSHQSGKVIPGFFVDDFSGDGPLYFQPPSGQEMVTSVKDCRSIMQLVKQLIPKNKIALVNGDVISRSVYKYRDTIQSEVVYDYGYGRRCKSDEWLSDEMTLQTLIAYIDKNRCGGGKYQTLPKPADPLLPLWMEEPDYPFTMVKERRERNISPRDSATTWLVNNSGKAWRKKEKEIPKIKLAELVKAAGNYRKKIKRPGLGEHLLLGSGWDLRKFAVDTDKPGNSKRLALYHEREDGSPDFISLIDSTGPGLVNLEVFPFVVKGGIVYFLHYFGTDPLHQEATEIPGFFVFRDKDRKHYYFGPEKGDQVGKVKNIGLVMQLENELHARRACRFMGGIAKELITYKYHKMEGKDKEVEKLEVNLLENGGKDCKFPGLTGKMDLEELVGFVQRGRCGSERKTHLLESESLASPIWSRGSGLKISDQEKAKKKLEKAPDA